MNYLPGYAYNAGYLLAARFGSYYHKPVDPTHCEKCKCAVNKAKAIRRYAKVESNQPTWGQCACGELISYK